MKCLAWLIAVRAGLSVFGYYRIKQFVQVPAKGEPSPHHARNVARRIARLAKFVPAASCLTQALALQAILARQGHPSVVRIGVAKSDNEEFAAHAWVECGGYVVLGHSTTNIADFTHIAKLT
jgi:hypothetical protein